MPLFMFLMNRLRGLLGPRAGDDLASLDPSLASPRNQSILRISVIVGYGACGSARALQHIGAHVNLVLHAFFNVIFS